MIDSSRSMQRLATAGEVADKLGVSTRWVYGQVEEHQMPAYRLGERALRFDLDAVAAWLESRKTGEWGAPKSCGRPISHAPI